MTITSIQSTERAQVIAPATASQPQQSNAAPSPQEPSVSAYYFSPVLKIDPQTQSVVIQYRNSETGAVTNQYPSEKDLKAYAAKQTFADIKDEPSASKTSSSFVTANQPAPTATVAASAVPPVSTFNSSTATGQQASAAATATTAQPAAPAATPTTSSSIVI
jgi:hypothetical protein